MNYHRILHRAGWSARAASRRLLGMLIEAFLPAGPVVLGIDDTIERRRSKRICRLTNMLLAVNAKPASGTGP